MLNDLYFLNINPKLINLIQGFNFTLKNQVRCCPNDHSNKIRTADLPKWRGTRIKVLIAKTKELLGVSNYNS